MWNPSLMMTKVLELKLDQQLAWNLVKIQMTKVLMQELPWNPAKIQMTEVLEPELDWKLAWNLQLSKVKPHVLQGLMSN